jgi:hypothetical protein
MRRTVLERRLINLLSTFLFPGTLSSRTLSSRTLSSRTLSSRTLTAQVLKLEMVIWA